jgi:hypothetical protein
MAASAVAITIISDTRAPGPGGCSLYMAKYGINAEPGEGLQPLDSYRQSLSNDSIGMIFLDSIK